MGDKINRIIALILIQLLLSANIALAGSPDRSCLSPSLNISAIDFGQTFDSYFSEQAEILKQPDTVIARRDFENSLYDLPFKVLFPRIIQYHLLNTVRIRMLAELETTEIDSIQVEYVSEDHVYELFKKHGEKNLNSLIGNEQIKWKVHPYTQTRDGKRYFVYEGLNWATKRASAKTNDERRRKYLIDSIRGCTDYKIKDLRAIPTGGLWKIYWQYKLPHEFGEKLIRNEQNVEFKVVVYLKDGTQIEAYINIRAKDARGQDYEVSFKREREIPDVISIAEINLPEIPAETFQTRVEKIKDDAFRQQMHILDGQSRDLANVIAAVKELNKIKTADLNGWQDGIEQESIDRVKQSLGEINSWLAKSKGKSVKKYQAHLKIEQAVKKWGLLSRGDIDGTIRIIDQALGLLDGRVQELFRGIGKRNIQLAEYAGQTEDEFFAVEVIKNELARIKAAVESNRFDAAVRMAEFAGSQYLKNNDLMGLIQDKDDITAQADALQAVLETGHQASMINDTIELIDKAEENKLELAKTVNDLQKAKDWFAGRKFTGLAQDTGDIIRDLNKATVRGNNYFFWISIAQDKLDDLINEVKAARGAKMNPGIKKIITGLLAGPNASLKSAMETAGKRNQGIKQFLPDQKLIGINQTKGLLRSRFSALAGVKDQPAMQNKVLDSIRLFVQELDRMQQKAALPFGFKTVGQIVPGLIRNLSLPVLVNQAI